MTIKELVTGMITKMVFEAIIAFVMLRSARYWENPEKYTSNYEREQQKIFERLFKLPTDQPLRPSKFSGCSFRLLAYGLIFIILIDLFVLLQEILKRW